MKLLIILFSSVLTFVLCSDCNIHKTCGECIRYASEICVWCAQGPVVTLNNAFLFTNRSKPNCFYGQRPIVLVGTSKQKKSYSSGYDHSFVNWSFGQENMTEPRCQPKEREYWCDPVLTYNPISSVVPSTESFNSEPGKEIQFRPHHIDIKIRPGVPKRFTMTYLPATDFPLDLYFLMDYSETMQYQKKQLQAQAIAIHEALTKMTKDVNLGIGSFIDKPGFPYTDIRYFKNRTYAFKNHLSLNEDMKLFQNIINSSVFGDNFDTPEAGLDALMQVMKCEHEIGWRNGSRRIIVLMTDSTYHSAGDGQPVGAYLRNDVKCHLKDNEYKSDDALLYDYPTVSQINAVATQGNFKIIFAASKTAKEDYTGLAKQIQNSKYVELSDKSNILNIIKKAYDESVKYVKLIYTPLPSVELVINQDCESDPKVNCESVPASPEVSIPAVIKVKDCTSDKNKIQEFSIRSLGLKDKVNIRLEIICQCDCENPDAKPTSECNFGGSKHCGVCICKKDRGGDKCQLNCAEEDDIALQDQCKQSEDDINLCSGHGNCRCGKCEKCNEDFSGEFCQFNNKDCPWENGRVCAGNGYCKYKKCQCNTDWIGEACSCSKLNTTCIDPFSSEVCSGRGYCDCGECKCDLNDDQNNMYSGKYCDICTDCAKERCDQLQDYAYCKYENEQAFCNDKFNKTTKLDVVFENKTEIDKRTSPKCKMQLEDGKFLIFKYDVPKSTNRLRLLIQRELELPPKANIWLAAIISISTVVIIGLITVAVWKILINIYDKREYEKFCDQAKSAGFDVSENPLYQQPNINFTNPAYSGSTN